MVRQRFSIVDIIIYLILGFLGISMLYPFINMLAVSFAPIDEVMKNSAMIFTKKPTFNAYEYVFKFGGLGDAAKVSFFVTIVGTAINMFMTVIAAFALAKKDLPGGKFIMKAIVISMIFHAGTIPMYIVVKNTGLLNTVWSLILPTVIDTYWLIIMRNYIMGLPESLSEAARIDGCTEYGLLVKIILPLCVPILASVVLVYLVAHWNNYTQAMLYINKHELKPMQLIIKDMYSSSGAMQELDNGDRPPVETVRAASVMIVTLPVLVVYPFLQKYFVQGIAAGAVKG